MADPIIIVPYDPDWVRMFEAERSLLLGTLEELQVQIEHIGSTSVPGLDAKPIIDIMIVAQNEGDALRCISPIVRLRYVYMGEMGIPGRIYFWRGSPHTYHIHLYSTPTNVEMSRHRLFRDFLVAHPDAAREYAQLKYHLADKFRNDRPQYSLSKSDFVEKILQEADTIKQTLEGE